VPELNPGPTPGPSPTSIVMPDGSPAPKAEPAEPAPEAKKGAKPEEPDWTTTPFPIDLFDNKIVIKRDDVQEMTDGGIILPESARRGEWRTMTGTVLATGPGIMKGDGSVIPLRVAQGDIVVFEKFRSMIPVTVHGFTYHILAETDLLGKKAASAHVKLR